jgi:carbonic anhydrase
MNEVLSTTFRKLRVYRKRSFKFDFIAALVVFLVAIPLCLGIALASGAPLFSGIISGIIGGIVVGFLSGSHVSVSGPAAGMAAVVLTAITQLGGFNVFLLALVLAGVLQVLLGSFKAGFIADYIPSNVIQGLLCAIGILLIIKQLPLAFTLSSDLAELNEHLLETTEGLSLTPLYQLSFHINSGAAIISLISFGLLIYFEKTKNKYFKAIPGPIVVVALGIILNEVFVLTNSLLAQNTPQLVNIPQHESLADFVNQMQAPQWSAFTNIKVYMYAFIIAIVASLESLLNVKAGEKLDPNKRYTSKDKELFAQGIGNLFTGLIGGIPVTSVVVRTTVNIQAGAKTKMATIFHGLFILVAVMILPGMLNKIPLCSLAAILIYTGYKLNKPSMYRSIYFQGWDRFIPFIATLISIVIFNLLAGILIGLMVSMFYILKSNSQVRIDLIKEVYPNGITNRLILPQQTTFLNKASLVAELDSIPRNSQLIIDARYSEFIDKEIVELIKDFQNEQAPHKQISLNLIGFKDHYDIHNYIDFITVTTYDVQALLKPSRVFNILQEGNQRFLKETRIYRSMNIEIQHTARTQHPIAVVLACMDSRVPVETIFDMTVGDIFCVRIGGNVVNDDILASVEYACNIVGAKLVVVLGHTHCGAVQAACDHIEQGHITQLLAKIQPAIDAEQETHEGRNSQNPQFVNRVIKLNIAHTLYDIFSKSTILRSMVENDDIGLVGALYDVTTGCVDFEDYSTKVARYQPANPLLEQKLHSLFEQANQNDEST